MDVWMDGCLGASAWVRPCGFALWPTPTPATLNIAMYCAGMYVVYLLSWKRKKGDGGPFLILSQTADKEHVEAKQYSTLRMTKWTAACVDGRTFSQGRPSCDTSLPPHK